MLSFSVNSNNIEKTFVYTMVASTGASINQHMVPINTFETSNYNPRELMLYDAVGNIVLGFHSAIV